MTQRGERLRCYLMQSAQKAVAWGEHDCCTLAADWIARETGTRPQLPRYRSAEEAHALIARAHGLLPLYAAELARLGLAPTDNPQVGDVGVVRLSFGDVSAIFGAGGIVYLLAERGITAIKPKHVLQSWSLEDAA